MEKVSNWVYVKCIRCNKQRDFSNKAFAKKLETLKTDKDNFIATYICKRCINNPIVEEIKENDEKLEEPILINEE